MSAKWLPRDSLLFSFIGFETKKVLYHYSSFYVDVFVNIALNQW